MTGRIVVDTSLILPFLGVRVHGLDHHILVSYAEQGYELLYPKLLLPELLGVVARVAEKSGLGSVPREAMEGLEALLAGEDVKLVEPRVEHLELALRLRLAGHRDIFDCILYATAVHEDAALVTMDRGLYEFLRERGFDASRLVLLVR